MRKSGVPVADVISDEFELESDRVVKSLVSLEGVFKVAHIVGGSGSVDSQVLVVTSDTSIFLEILEVLGVDEWLHDPTGSG